MSRKNWSNEKVFKRLLTNKTRKTYWDNIGELRLRGNIEIFEKAYYLTKSKTKKEKIIGIDVLAQLSLDLRPYKNETVKVFFQLLNSESDKDILMSLFYGIGHNNENLTSSQISKMIKFKNQEEAEVKLGLVSALLGIENRKVIDTLIELTEDKASSIRNLATFGIGSQIEISNKKIIAALWKRTKDKHQETKFEAIVGLANRGENEVKRVIFEELEKGEYGTLLFKAIETLNDKSFLPQLEKDLGSVKNDDTVSESWIKELINCIEAIRN